MGAQGPPGGGGGLRDAPAPRTRRIPPCGPNGDCHQGWQRVGRGWDGREAVPPADLATQVNSCLPSPANVRPQGRHGAKHGHGSQRLGNATRLDV